MDRIKKINVKTRDFSYDYVMPEGINVDEAMVAVKETKFETVIYILMKAQNPTMYVDMDLGIVAEEPEPEEQVETRHMERLMKSLLETSPVFVKGLLDERLENSKVDDLIPGVKELVFDLMRRKLDDVLESFVGEPNTHETHLLLGDEILEVIDEVAEYVNSGCAGRDHNFIQRVSERVGIHPFNVPYCVNRGECYHEQRDRKAMRKIVIEEGHVFISTPGSIDFVQQPRCYGKTKAVSEFLQDEADKEFLRRVYGVYEVDLSS